MTLDPQKVRPQGTWLFCRPLQPTSVRKSGLILPKDWDKDVTGEGVAEVLSVGPDVDDVKPGDRIVYRGFLRYAQQVGEMFGADKPSDYFLLNVHDALAVAVGSGTLGTHEEYVLKEDSVKLERVQLRIERDLKVWFKNYSLGRGGMSRLVQDYIRDLLLFYEIPANALPHTAGAPQYQCTHISFLLYMRELFMAIGFQD